MAFKSILDGTGAAAGLMAPAAPSVTLGDVKTGEPWSTITVGYTLSGVDADLDYKVAFRTAIHEDGSLYAVPTVVVPGHAMVLYGTESLENPDWREIDSTVQMQKSGCHFFKFVLKKVR